MLYVFDSLRPLKNENFEITWGLS
jgi:hypothetical protein